VISYELVKAGMRSIVQRKIINKILYEVVHMATIRNLASVRKSDFISHKFLLVVIR